jgi:PTS system ascorbate-specific IIC component
LPLLGSLGYANSTFGDADFVLTGIIVGTIGKIFSQEGIYVLLAILFVTFVALQMKAKMTPQVKE